MSDTPRTDECSDAKEQAEGCLRALRAERELAEARAKYDSLKASLDPNSIGFAMAEMLCEKEDELDKASAEIERLRKDAPLYTIEVNE